MKIVQLKKYPYGLLLVGLIGSFSLLSAILVENAHWPGIQGEKVCVSFSKEDTQDAGTPVEQEEAIIKQHHPHPNPAPKSLGKAHAVLQNTPQIGHPSSMDGGPSPGNPQGGGSGGNMGN